MAGHVHTCRSIAGQGELREPDCELKFAHTPRLAAVTVRATSAALIDSRNRRRTQLDEYNADPDGWLCEYFRGMVTHRAQLPPGPSGPNLFARAASSWPTSTVPSVAEPAASRRAPSPSSSQGCGTAEDLLRILQSEPAGPATPASRVGRRRRARSSRHRTRGSARCGGWIPCTSRTDGC